MSGSLLCRYEFRVEGLELVDFVLQSGAGYGKLVFEVEHRSRLPVFVILVYTVFLPDHFILSHSIFIHPQTIPDAHDFTTSLLLRVSPFLASYSGGPGSLAGLR